MEVRKSYTLGDDVSLDVTFVDVTSGDVAFRDVALEGVAVSALACVGQRTHVDRRRNQKVLWQKIMVDPKRP
jgi:hypothetical protein